MGNFGRAEYDADYDESGVMMLVHRRCERSVRDQSSDRRKDLEMRLNITRYYSSSRAPAFRCTLSAHATRT